MKYLCYLFFPFLFSCASTGKSTSETPASVEKPNIIFIMADDLGYGDLGSFGQKIIRTPNLDQLAEEGMKFTHCYAGSPVCAPSRSVLMTGLHTGHTTVRGNFGVGGVVGLGGGKGRIPLEANDLTVAEVLKEAGYVTGMTGKWGLGEPTTSGEPVKQGFDEFFGYMNQRRAHSYYVPYLWKNSEKLEIEGNQGGAEGTYVHDLFTEYALDFLDRHRDTSFFLYLPYTIPHSKYEIPDLGLYADSTQWGKDAQVHAAMVSRLDGDIGKIMDLLKRLKLDDNTYVFFCSDNGAAEFWKGIFDSSGSLRGRKRDLYEGGIRTPMIVWHPGKVPPGTTHTQPWMFMDILPSFASLAGARIPKGLDGKDISPAFTNPNWRLEERTLYWEFYERDFQQAIRWKDWKGIKLAIGAEWELYNLNKDPSEKNNIAANHPEIVQKMEGIAQREHVPSKYFRKGKKK